MVLYKTDVENFNKKIVYYLEEIKLEEKKREGRYNFVNSIGIGGVIYCSTLEEKNFEKYILINSIGCSQEIENKLEELTKN